MNVVIKMTRVVRKTISEGLIFTGISERSHIQADLCRGDAVHSVVATGPSG